MKFLVTNCYGAMLEESKRLHQDHYLMYTPVSLKGKVKTPLFCAIKTQWKNMFFILTLMTKLSLSRQTLIIQGNIHSISCKLSHFRDLKPPAGQVTPLSLSLYHRNNRFCHARPNSIMGKGWTIRHKSPPIVLKHFYIYFTPSTYRQNIAPIAFFGSQKLAK